MAKIYNEIVIDMNPESPTFEETLYEDSFEYNGSMMLMQEEGEWASIKLNDNQGGQWSQYQFTGGEWKHIGTGYSRGTEYTTIEDLPQPPGETYDDLLDRLDELEKTLDDYTALDPDEKGESEPGAGDAFNIKDYQAAQGTEGGIEEYFTTTLGFTTEDYEKYFRSGMNQAYIGPGGFFEQTKDLDVFTAGAQDTASAGRFGIAGGIAAEGYRAGKADYTTGLAELAEMARSGQESYDIGVDVGKNTYSSGMTELGIGRTEAREAWRAGTADVAAGREDITTSGTEAIEARRAGQATIDIGVKEMAEGRTAATEAYDIAGMGIAEGQTAALKATEISESMAGAGFRAGQRAFTIAQKGMDEGMRAGEESYRIGGLEIGESLRAGLSAVEIGEAGVAETRRATAEQYGTGIEGEGMGLQTQRAIRGQQRSLIGLGEAAEAGASRAGFAGGGTGARRAERARGNLWEDFGQQQKELEAAKTGALNRADLQSQSLASERTGLAARFGTAVTDAEGNITGTTGGTAQARRASAMAGVEAQYGETGISAAQQSSAWKSITDQYGTLAEQETGGGGYAGLQRTEATRAAGAMYGTAGEGGGILETQRAAALRQAGAQYGTVDAAGEVTQGFGGQRLGNQLSGLESQYGVGGGGGTFGSRLTSAQKGLESRYGDTTGVAGGTFGMGLTNQGNRLTSQQVGLRSQFGAGGFGGTANRRSRNQEQGLVSQFGRGGTGGTYGRGLSNTLAGVTSITGTMNADGDWEGGTGRARNESAWTGAQSRWGAETESGDWSGGGTYMQGADLTRNYGKSLYESVMGGDVRHGGLAVGSAELNYDTAVSDYYQGIEDDYWGMLTQYEAGL